VHSLGDIVDEDHGVVETCHPLLQDEAGNQEEDERP
jgi:hypothetical protein